MATAFTLHLVLLMLLMTLVAATTTTAPAASQADPVAYNQQGRTFVHHTMKRLAVLLPVLTFKLGIMFTMLLVTALASTKGLLVGALLLALGVGHFIAGRFAIPAVAPAATVALQQPVHRVHVLPAAASTAPWSAAQLHHHVDKVEPAVYAHPYTSWRSVR